MRILAVADLWQGSDAYAYVRAFRRLGHSVRTLSPDEFVPSKWQAGYLKALRRIAEPALVRQFKDSLIAEARSHQAQMFFVFKGRYVHPDAVAEIRNLGAVAVNVYPDVSFMAHGRYLPRALPLYDWIFTTKSFGMDDLRLQLGMERASFIPPSFDPEVHYPVTLEPDEEKTYGCDASFIGTWSPKKQALMEVVKRRLPKARIRIWGMQWGPAQSTLGDWIQGRGVLGLEFSKAMVASKINLCILSEARKGASSGDRVTARSFHIPATGAFMLHERTDELAEYFREGIECGCFTGPEELADQIRDYLDNAQKRRAVGAAGRQRCLDSGYAVDHRAALVARHVADVLASRHADLRTANIACR